MSYRRASPCKIQNDIITLAHQKFASMYHIENEKLYQKIYGGSLLKCLKAVEAREVMKGSIKHSKNYYELVIVWKLWKDVMEYANSIGKTHYDVA